ncbi:hypothetical protein F3N42_03245 [Marinihelvus fidelis]|uniref:ABC-type transport auxiliary lipoprotein component domain-containing protein n=1 Tax=Marinihelvus fidelis TaxID=2613842 RepID=A0A5N0TGW9_9GAMM|nr:ABC-type transport auxiliary lipoprotein family protein [Marinihelvus fidelis]KAA9133377.1 hypothetical protein F3N42_03245 [Marinihelvus fidelis]
MHALLRRTLRALPGACLALATMLAAGCTTLLDSEQPAPSTWWLAPATLDVTTIAGPPRPLSLSISVVPGLDTDRILTLEPDARLDHIAGAHWADHLPELLGSLAIRSLEGAPRFSEISMSDYRRPGECRLAIEARSFWVRMDADGQARHVDVELAGAYQCDDIRTPLALTARVPVSQTRLPTIVAAFQAATDEVFTQLAGVLAAP